MSVEAITKPPIAGIAIPPVFTEAFKNEPDYKLNPTLKLPDALALARKPLVIIISAPLLLTAVLDGMSPRVEQTDAGIGPERGRHRFSNGSSNEINRGTVLFSPIKSVDRLKYRRGSGRSRRCRIHGERHSSGNQCGGDGISKPQPFFISRLPLKTLTFR